MDLKERLLGPVTRRWPAAATAVRVQERFSEVHGTQLAAAVTLASFLSVFPLLLAAIGIVGFLSHNVGELPFLRGVANLPEEVISRLGLTGQAAQALRDAMETAERSRRAASILGLAGLLLSGLGLVAAVEFMCDAVWQVSGRGFKDKLWGLAWLAGATVIFLGSFTLTALLRHLPGPAAPVALVVALVVDAALWLWTFRVLTNRDVGWRAHLPGAVLGAVGLEVLKVVGGIYVPMAVTSSSVLYGPLGVVFAILAWLLVFGRLVVYTAVFNVVRWENRHGTVTAEIELPRMLDEVPVGTTRAGEAQPQEPT